VSDCYFYIRASDLLEAYAFGEVWAFFVQIIAVHGFRDAAAKDPNDASDMCKWGPAIRD
jgi:hypothetical protein